MAGFKDTDLSKFDPNSFNVQFNLKIIYASSTNKKIEYEGFLEEIMSYGVRLRTKESCAVGHNIIFKIVKDKREILNGTGKIDSIEKTEGALQVICTFFQFSEEDKKRLIEEASLNQKEIKDYMDDLS